jgi:hypothetical protein
MVLLCSLAVTVLVKMNGCSLGSRHSVMHRDSMRQTNSDFGAGWNIDRKGKENRVRIVT